MKAIALAHGLDLLTVALVINRLGIAVEGNPIAQALYAAGGLALMALFKAGYLGVAYLGSLHLRPGTWRVMRVYSIALGAFGATMNTLALSGIAR